MRAQIEGSVAIPTSASQARTALASARPGTLRAGQGHGEPLVLLHGVTGSSHMWSRVLPLLAPYHDVIAPSALGHHRGPRALVRPTRIEHVIDDAERFLDQLGLDRVHLAGNSMGGWVALELARRGRARSVCALSPAGAWVDDDQQQAARKLRAIVRQTRAGRWALPLLARSASFRRWALRDTVVRGDQVSEHELLALADSLLACEVREDLFDTDESLAHLSASCPITLAWSGQDRIFPVDIFGTRARSLVPGAEFTVLEGVGHVPMLEAPELVAQTILQTSARASA
ncbi:MAG: putative hydrolase [Myxococcaceae bacterium]|nr:putative hydrolase [Myxococcaceae bacterium]